MLLFFLVGGSSIFIIIKKMPQNGQIIFYPANCFKKSQMATMGGMPRLRFAQRNYSFARFARNALGATAFLKTAALTSMTFFFSTLKL